MRVWGRVARTGNERMGRRDEDEAALGNRVDAVRLQVVRGVPATRGTRSLSDLPT